MNKRSNGVLECWSDEINGEKFTGVLSSSFSSSFQSADSRTTRTIHAGSPARYPVTPILHHSRSRFP
jgi:hypothetical protein